MVAALGGPDPRMPGLALGGPRPVELLVEGQRVGRGGGQDSSGRADWGGRGKGRNDRGHRRRRADRGPPGAAGGGTPRPPTQR
eukprot:13143046-Alexandrium_andersonii.AAC.1